MKGKYYCSSCHFGSRDIFANMYFVEYVILVNRNDEKVGLSEKMNAHKKGLLHRAFSVFIFNKKGQMLLQQRALSKYHCGGLWSNACCSHPRDKEELGKASSRRLFEEMGLKTNLEEIFTFQYKVDLQNGLIENEIDHVLIGEITTDTTPAPNPEEVQALRWVSIESLQKELAATPQKFTPWLLQALELVNRHQR